MKPKDSFKECDNCPEMVVVPAGEFLMGSPAGDKDIWHGNEKPQHKVTIARPFAVSKFEVTFAEWGACTAAGACNGYEPNDRGWGLGTWPVIYVSWNDATAYAGWLSAKTGQRYRLLSEAEWEYTARAGTTTAYSWGEDIGKGNANCSGCGSKWDSRQTAPVGSFKPNAFGLYDMHGNVSEWCEDDTWGDYNGAPTDGSAWLPGNVEGYRVVRGGDWVGGREFLRAADREWKHTDFRSGFVGFRLARTLNP